MSGTTPRGRHGLAGLLAILFVVGGLVFSYGLGHAPVARVCTEHAMSAPAGAVAAAAQAAKGAQVVTGVEGAAGAALASAAAMSLGQDAPDISLNACLCLAVLFTLMLLGMAAGPGGPAFRLPARVGWAVPLPSGGVRTPVSRHSLQVLRL